jgi:hypothetical protein
MSMRDCLLRAVEKGQADKGKADAVLKTYDDLVNSHLAAGRTPVEANDMAGRDALAHAEGKTKADKLRRLTTARKHAELDTFVKEFRDQHGDFAPDRALEQIIVDMDARIDTVRMLLHNSVNEFLEKSGYKGVGIIRERAHLDGTLKALFDEGGSRTDKQLAKSLKEMSRLRTMLLREGGLSVAHDPLWRLPQNHSRAKIKEAGAAAWVEHHMGEGILDWDRMKDFNDNLPIVGAVKKNEVLQKVFRSIISDGANSIVPGARVDASLSTRLERPRVMHYANSKAWKASMESYGEGDMFEQISMFIETSATDIAMVQKLGPNPKSGLAFAIDTALKHADTVQPTGMGDKHKVAPGREASLKARVESSANAANSGFEILAGANAMTEENILGRTAAGSRNILISSLLGGTPLVSVPSDQVSMALAANRNGMRGHAVIARTLKQLNPLSAKDRQAGRSSGMVLETLISRASASRRFVGDVMAPGLTRAIADVSTRASFLSQTTRAAKWAMGMEFQSTLARSANRTFKSLDKNLRISMERNGITEQDWDAIRATPIHDPSGFNQLRVVDIIKRTDISDGEKIRLHGLVGDMMNKIILEGVPEATTLSGVTLGKNVKRGTPVGEVTAFAAMLKSFPVAIYQLHLREYYRNNPGYLPAYTLGMMGAGVLAMQLGAISTGKDPYDMADPKTWGAGALKGGGLGILGDFLFSNLNRFGGGMADTLAGPFFGLASDATNLSIGNISQMLSGENTNLTAEAVEFINNWTPGTRTWYARLLKERLLVDRIRQEVDPRARTKMLRREQKQQTEEGRGTWWNAGSQTPRRAPQLSHAP